MNIRYYKFIFLLLLSGLLTGHCQNGHNRSLTNSYKNDSLPLFSSNQLRKDFILFRTALEEAHPGLYRYTPKEKFDIAFNDGFSRLNEKRTLPEFYKILTPLVGLINCGHTHIALPENFLNDFNQGLKMIPVRLKFINKRSFILQNLSSDERIKPGMELISINGVSIEKIIGIIFPHLTSDGYIETSKYRRTENLFGWYYALYIDQPEEFKLTLRDPEDGKSNTLDDPSE